MLGDGRSEEVVRVKDEDNFFINLSYLTRYAAAKQMAVILYYDVRTQFDESMDILGVTEFSDGYKDNPEIKPKHIIQPVFDKGKNMISE